MATITKKKVLNQQAFGGTPYGNVTGLAFNLTTNAAGAFIDSDTATGIALGDKVRLGVLPAGIRLNDSNVIVSTAFTASLTGTLGFEYVDGVDSTAVPQNASYFGAALALNAAGRLRNATSNAPVILPKDAYLILTTAGAANAKAAQADIVIEGVLTGAP
jgi:hypothetical protein